MALSLLGNCATQPEVLKAVSTSCDAEGQPSVVAVTKLLSNQDPALSTKAATLIGNLCHDSTLRSQVFLTGRFGTDVTTCWHIVLQDGSLVLNLTARKFAACSAYA